MAFKDNFRIEKIYFQRVKDDAQTLASWKTDPRRFSDEEITAIAKNACDSILMLYRLIGEAWNDALNHIEKLSAELDALAGKAEAYHDELNEKIDEVNNYLNSEIKNIEAQIDAFGGLPSNANASEGDVLTVGVNGVNEWREAGEKHYVFNGAATGIGETDTTVEPYNLTIDFDTVAEIYDLIDDDKPFYVFLTFTPYASESAKAFLRGSMFTINHTTDENDNVYEIIISFYDHSFGSSDIGYRKVLTIYADRDVSGQAEDYFELTLSLTTI